MPHPGVVFNGRLLGSASLDSLMEEKERVSAVLWKLSPPAPHEVGVAVSMPWRMGVVKKLEGGYRMSIKGMSDR